MSDNNEFGAFLTGLVIGGLVGATVSLLMAPQSGEETREQIRIKSLELRDRADDEIRQIRTYAEQAVADARGQIEELQARASSAVADARTRIESAIEASRGNSTSAAE